MFLSHVSLPRLFDIGGVINLPGRSWWRARFSASTVFSPRWSASWTI